MSTSIGFASTIKPYFTSCYRQHMLDYTQQKLDLWDPMTVQNAGVWQAIYNKVSSGDMPQAGCPEGVWDDTMKNKFLSDFQAWKNAGYPP